MVAKTDIPGADLIATCMYKLDIFSSKSKMEQKGESVTMKGALALIAPVVCVLVILSCDNFPYKPSEFIVPKVAPPPNAFVAKDSLAGFVGGAAKTVKLAYTLTPTGGSQTVYFVNFGDSVVAPKELRKDNARSDWDAWCPIISPNGALVTYYLRSGTQAAAYCQPLDTAAAPVPVGAGSEPHFYKDGLGNLFVTYTDANGIMLDGTSATLTGYHTYKQKVDPATGQKMGPPDTVASYPFYGGMSWNGNYICTGYSSAYIYNCVKGTFFAVNPGQQTCNPSMTPDSILTGRMMFLNIGGHEQLNQLPPGDTGRVGEHKFVFVADTNNNYVYGFELASMLPAYSAGEWQCPKWTNVPDFFCALAAKSTNGSKVVYDCILVSISSKRMLLLNARPDLLQFESSSKPYVYIGGN